MEMMQKAAALRKKKEARALEASEAALDFRYLRACVSFQKLLVSASRESLAEVFMHDLLAKHPRRTHNAGEAQLFYVPVWQVAVESQRPHLPPLVVACRRTTRPIRRPHSCACANAHAACARCLAAAKPGLTRSRAALAAGATAEYKRPRVATV